MESGKIIVTSIWKMNDFEYISEVITFDFYISIEIKSYLYSLTISKFSNVNVILF